MISSGGLKLVFRSVIPQEVVDGRKLTFLWGTQLLSFSMELSLNSRIATLASAADKIPMTDPRPAVRYLADKTQGNV